MLVIRLTLVVLALSALAPTAAAASATAEPASAAPGARMLLVYMADAGAADIRAMDSVTCTIEGSEPIDCGASTELIVVGLGGGPRTYAFDILAPATLGAYTARFVRTSLAAVPPANGAAEANFEVVAPPLGPSATQPEPILPGSTDIDAPADNGGRWLLSLFMASGATSAAAVLARRPGGP